MSSLHDPRQNGLLAALPEDELALLLPSLELVHLSLGEETTTNWAVVQSAGHAYRLSGLKLREVFSRGGSLQQNLRDRPRFRLTPSLETVVCPRLLPIVAAGIPAGAQGYWRGSAEALEVAKCATGCGSATE